jgi:hypothetical protein
MGSVTDGADQPTFGLDKVLEALRNDLLAAQKAASTENAGLTIKETEVELAFTVEAKTGGGGNVNLKVFGVGIGGGASKEKNDSSVHRVKITLTPLAGTNRAIAGGQPGQESRKQSGG